MLALIPFPDIDPNLFSFEVFGRTLAVRWYALAYIAGFLLAWVWANRALRRPHLWANDTPPMSLKQAEDLLTWMIVGVILGGRIGYVLFYNTNIIFSDPAAILRIWEGGMSFHGGFLGVIAAGFVFCWRQGLSPWGVGDTLALGIPLGLGLGRIANFINAELWGRPTTQPWGVVFPTAPDCPIWWLEPVCARHPSQLYEAILEGLVLFVVIGWLAYRRGALKVPGQLIAVFWIGYGLARIIVEGFRQGDSQFTDAGNPWGHIIRFGSEIDSLGLSMGQILSIPMVLIGVVIWVIARKRA
ncbi:MAG: prolipoprotein diacylglyceryl transferase [Rhodobacteraceae bacterium]|nr:prolipoprotein diacylglyceryl transferase [Paracoccaceae bacterium]